VLHRTAFVATLATALVSLARPAAADSITLFGGASFTQLTNTSVAGDTLTSVGTFTPFDPALGTLVSASFQFSGQGGATKTLGGLLPGDYTWRLSVAMTLLAPDDSLVLALGAAVGSGVVTLTASGDAPPFGTGTPF